MSKDWQKPIKRLLREAWVTQINLPNTGTRPGGYGCTMPDIVRDISEAYGYDTATIGRITPTAAQIDRLDLVLASMASQEITENERHLLWARAGQIEWKRISRRLDLQRTQMWRVYNQALASFALALINRERKAA